MALSQVSAPLSAAVLGSTTKHELSASRFKVSSRAARPICRPSSHGALACRAQQEGTASSATPAVAQDADPTISLKFLGPGDAPGAEFSLGSGTKNLRRAMLDAKVPVYDMYGSLMNCNGGGSCGTCMVDIREGGDLLSGRTEAEDKYLKKRPESWRLACQTIVGDKTNSGSVVVRNLPQKN